MNLSRTSAPAKLPVTLAEAKTHLRVDTTEEDDRITGILGAATAHVDGYAGVLGRPLITQTWALKLERFPRYAFIRSDLRAGRPIDDRIRLPLPPVQSVSSITYVDPDGATQTWAAAKYQLVAKETRPHVVPAYGETWPTTRDVPEAVTVTFVAGYGDDTTDVPEPIRQAILLLAGHWYQHREAVATGVVVNEVKMAVDALLTPYRVGLAA